MWVHTEKHCACGNVKPLTRELEIAAFVALQSSRPGLGSCLSCSLSVKLACSCVDLALSVLGSFFPFCVQKIIFCFACLRCCAGSFGMFTLAIFFPVCGMCANCRTLSAVGSILGFRLCPAPHLTWVLSPVFLMRTDSSVGPIEVKKKYVGLSFGNC